MCPPDSRRGWLNVISLPSNFISLVGRRIYWTINKRCNKSKSQGEANTQTAAFHLWKQKMLCSQSFGGSSAYTMYTNNAKNKSKSQREPTFRQLYFFSTCGLGTKARASHHRSPGGEIEAYQKAAIGDLPWMDETGPLSIRPTLELLQKQHWGNLLRNRVECISAFPSA